MWEFTPEQATACRHTAHPLPVRAPVPLAAITFIGSHILALLCSLQSHWFQQKFHPKSRPAHTSHGRWWTALTHYGRWAQQRPSALAPARTHTATAQTPAALSSPLFPSQPRPQAQALTRQCDKAGSHHNSLCSHSPPKCGVKTPMGPTVVPSTLLALQVLAPNKTMRTSHPKE